MFPRRHKRGQSTSWLVYIPNDDHHKIKCKVSLNILKSNWIWCVEMCLCCSFVNIGRCHDRCTAVPAAAATTSMAPHRPTAVPRSSSSNREACGALHPCIQTEQKIVGENKKRGWRRGRGRSHTRRREDGEYSWTERSFREQSTTWFWCIPSKSLDISLVC